MEHPEDDENEGYASIAQPQRRLSRFREQLTSTHTPAASLHKIPTAPVSPHPPVSSPSNIIQRLAREHKSQTRRQKCNLLRSSTLKLKVKPKPRKKSNTSTPPITTFPARHLNTRSSVATFVSSNRRRRSHALERIYAHRLAKKIRKKWEKEEREKQETRLKGTVWGYDPTAGRLMTHESRCTASHSALNDVHLNGRPDGQPTVGCYIFRGAKRYSNGSDEYGSEEIDNLGRRSGRLWV